MSIRRDLRTYLLTKTGLTNLITGADNKRHLHLSYIPQGDTSIEAYPAIVYRRATGEHDHDLDGSSGRADPVFEFAVLSVDPNKTEDIAEQLRLAMQGFKGSMASTSVDTVTLTDEYDQYIDSKIGDAIGFYVTYLEYKIGYHESIPTP